MSHLILGVIGIMLAAAAALIVVNYGGDYYLDAYNDGSGVTASFNLNLLRRINRELGGHFVVDRFRHF